MHKYFIFLWLIACISTAYSQIKMQDKPRTSRGGIALVNESKPRSRGTFDILKGMKDEDIFIDIDGRDRLSWKAIRQYIEIMNGPVSMRHDIEADQRNAVQETANALRLKKIMQAYLKNAMYASAAIKAGVVVGKEEFDQQRRKTRDLYSKRGDKGRRFIELMDAPDSFYEHNLTNILYAQAYAEKIIKPSIEVTGKDIDERIAYQNDLNSDAMKTNDFKKALLVDILQKVRSGFDFGEAAEKWSDCPTFDTKGVFTDVDEKPQKIYPGAVHPVMEETYKKLSPGEISDIIETPYSWHILKLLKRHPQTDDEETSVELAHIMLEKELLQPVLTKDQARERILNRQVRIELKKRLPKLFMEAKIDCKIPIFDKKKKKIKSKNQREDK